MSIITVLLPTIEVNKMHLKKQTEDSRPIKPVTQESYTHPTFHTTTIKEVNSTTFLYSKIK